MKRGQAFNRLTELLKRFPSIGQRQAERLTYFLATASPQFTQNLSEAIIALKQQTRQCPECFIYYENLNTDDQAEVCEFCKQEDADILVLVEKDVDVYAIESSRQEHYRYFILGGLIPIARDISDTVRLKSFLKQVNHMRPKEIIIALSVHPDAEHTQRYIIDALQKQFPDLPVSSLGRGLSSGSELEYSSPDTLLNALARRTKN